MKGKKLTIDFVRKQFEAKGYKLLETKYANAHTKMRYRCSHHPDKELKITWNDFNSRHHGCPYCARNAKLDFDFVKSEFEKRGYELLEDKYVNANTPMNYKCVHHPNETLKICYKHIQQGHGCPYCAGNIRHKYNFIKSEFEKCGYELLDNKYTNANTLMKYKCKYHPNEILSMSYSNLKQGHKCPICYGSKLIVGLNSIWDTNEELARLLLHPEDGYKYMQYSNKKVDWKCSDCGNIIKNKTIANINTYGLSCGQCGDGISYPNKIMYNVLQQLNIKFHTEQHFNWCKFKLNDKDYNGRYDFIFELNNQNYLIEVDGGFHFSKKQLGKLFLEDVQFIDFEKDRLAKENGYIIIRINCLKSELEYIKCSIISSELNNLFDLTNIDWNSCHKNALKSKIIEACELWNSGIRNAQEIADILKISKVSIITYLKKCSKINICDYNPQQEMINSGKKSSKKIVCKNTNQIFNSIKEASVYYDIKSGCIGRCCSSKRNFTGQHPETKEKLQWQYYDPLIHTPENGYSYV